jgi:hypothetical protein
MKASLSSLQDHALDQLVADAMHTRTVSAQPNRAVLERLKTFEEFYDALDQPPAAPALMYRDASDNIVRSVLIGDAITIGRGNQCNLAFPADNHLSRLHCSIALEDGFYVLKDHNSHNRTFINAMADPINEHMLRDGDIISAGNQTFVYSCGQVEWNEEASGTGESA